MQRTIMLKADSELPINVAGKYVTVISCTASFKLEADRRGQSVMVAGGNYGDGRAFKRLNFAETSGADNIIVVDIGDAPGAGRSQVVQAGAATFVGENSGSYTAAVFAETFPGVDSVGRARKVMHITNQEKGTTRGLNVAVGSDIVMRIMPDDPPIAIETSATISFVSDSPSVYTVGYSILEIFYSKPLQSDQ